MENENLTQPMQETAVEFRSSDPNPLDPQAGGLVEQTPVDEIIISGDLTDDDRNRIYKKLGRPDSYEGYDFSDLVPENYNQSLVDQFRQKAFENGMSTEGARKMAEWYKQIETEQQNNLNKARQQQSDMWIMELKKDFGVGFDDNIKHARKALDAYTDPTFRKYMDETGLGNHPSLVKAFAKIGRELSEDRLVQSETATRLAKNEDLKRSEILRLRSDAAFMERYRKGDQVAVARLNRLYLED
jgi:hypothetical protein